MQPSVADGVCEMHFTTAISLVGRLIIVHYCPLATAYKSVCGCLQYLIEMLPFFQRSRLGPHHQNNVFCAGNEKKTWGCNFFLDNDRGSLTLGIYKQFSLFFYNICTSGLEVASLLLCQFIWSQTDLTEFIKNTKCQFLSRNSAAQLKNKGKWNVRNLDSRTLKSRFSTEHTGILGIFNTVGVTRNCWGKQIIRPAICSAVTWAR